MGRAKGWTCQRQTNGKVCKHHNLPRTRKCVRCGKARPPKCQPAHRSALNLTYDEYIIINGGEHCGICGRKPSKNRKLDRDHDHHTHLPRGLLCSRCNRALPSWVTIDWLERAILYLRKALLYLQRVEDSNLS